MNDAELLLGLWRHLSTYQASPATAALGSLEAAGKIYEMAWRLRSSGVSSIRRVHAISVEAKIRTFDTDRLILPTLEQLGWIKLNRNRDNEVVSVDDVIPPPEQLIELATNVLDIVRPSPVERAALAMLRATSHQPLEHDAAIEESIGFGGEDSADEALRHLKSLNLVREIEAEDGRSAVFNPNIWVGDSEISTAALRVEDARVRKEIGGLLEEVSKSPGIPESAVTSTEKRWIDFAVSHGLIQRSVVETSEGNEQRFLFSPHLHRDAFGVDPSDSSGHVRQMVGSMIYASTFAKVRLDYPSAFLRRLISDGEAGDASPIGTDYPMLETAGIVRVIQGSSSNKYRLELLQSDVAESALDILEARENTTSGGSNPTSLGGLRAQRSYVHVERERAQLAHDVPVDDVDMKRLVAALRETSRRGFRGR